MTKHDLIRAIAARTGEKISTVEAVIASLNDVVHENAAAKEETTLGFGKIKTVEKAARIGRNPRTGEAKEIAARTTIKFTAHKYLKDAANGVGK